MHRNAISTLLVLCLVVPTAMLFIFFHFEKEKIKKEVKKQIIAGIDRSELVLLRFSKTTAQKVLHWEDSEEFEYEGQLFDVVEKTSKADSVYYWCWLDTKETELERQWKDKVATVFGNDISHKRNQKRLDYFYKSLFFYFQKEKIKTLLLSNWTDGRIDRFPISSAFYKPPTPPPEL